jgi:hypothetical protein
MVAVMELSTELTDLSLSLSLSLSIYDCLAKCSDLLSCKAFLQIGMSKKKFWLKSESTGSAAQSVSGKDPLFHYLCMLPTVRYHLRIENTY